MKVYSILRNLLVLSLLLASTLACCELILVLQSSQRALQSASQLIQQTSNDLHGTSQNVNAILLQTGLASDEIRRAATEQRTYWRKTSKQTERTVASANQLLTRINSELIPRSATVLDTTSLSVASVGNAADAARSTLSAATDAINTIRDQAANPDLTASMANMAAASRSLADASQNVAATTKDMRDAVHRATKPGSLAMGIISHALDIGGKIGSIFAGLVK